MPDRELNDTVSSTDYLRYHGVTMDPNYPIRTVTEMPTEPATPVAPTTDKLTLEEFKTLANLLRRFEMHHARVGAEHVAVVAADQAIRHRYSVLYVPGYDERSED